MAITKPAVLPPWAESGDTVQPTDAEIQVGWPAGATPPSRQRFNWVLRYGMNGVRYLMRRGIPDWDADDTYSAGARVQGPDGLTYESLTTNTGATPASSPTDWRRWGLYLSDVSSISAGSIMMFPATAAPAGWLKCNGALLSRATYANLWAYAQASGNLVSDADWTATARPGSFSTGDGSTTFRIPDFRGLFVRGYHDGSGAYDTDTATPIGRYRDAQNKEHTHTIKMDGSTYASGTSPTASAQEFAGTTTYTDRILSSGGAEAYPRHASALICIKY